jgi:RNA polymerase sigma-70 factor (ECF subfamily)
MEALSSKARGNFRLKVSNETPVAASIEETGRQRQRLMERAQDGDREAFRELFQEIGPLITGFIRRRLRDPSDVEDVCQEALMAVYRSRRTYQAARPFEPWLFAIVRNVTARHLSNHFQRSRWQSSVDELPELRVEDDSSLPLEMGQAFANLSPAQFEAITLTKLEGLSIEEAARRAGASAGSMKVRVHRAYESLKRSILR